MGKCFLLFTEVSSSYLCFPKFFVSVLGIRGIVCHISKYSQFLMHTCMFMHACMHVHTHTHAQFYIFSKVYPLTSTAKGLKWLA